MNYTITEDIEKEIMDVINYMQPLIKSHKGSVTLLKAYGNTVHIVYGDRCIDCAINCIKETLEDKFPDINFIFN